ncbi:hypothetical protein TNCV_321221, partial [Trichonephila clavipes]
MQQEVTGVPCSCPCVKEACPPERFPGIPCVFLLVKSAREVPAFRFSRRRMRKMFPVSPPAML